MAIEKQPSCEDDEEPALLPVDVALQRLASMVLPLSQTETETVGIREALDRVLSSDVLSPIDVPSYTNSAMDGYALNSRDLPAAGEVTLAVLGTAWAGRPLEVTVARGEAVRIMTGGMMPPGTDTVVIQEHVQALYDTANENLQGNSEVTHIIADGTTAPGRNVRQAGEDIKAGEKVIATGTQLTPAHIGLLASLGVDQVQVYRCLKVAFFSTGDELRALETHAGQALGPGELFDSNRHTLFAMLKRLGVTLIDIGVVADTKEATRQAFIDASSQADVVISSGGVSAGQADFVSATLAELGKVTFWKLAMRPGRPLAYGKVGDAHFFGLPGNPVAVMVTFYEFVQPSIKRLMGCTETAPAQFTARCESRLKKSPGRIEYQRGIVSAAADGEVTVRVTGKQGAGRLTSMAMANCLIVIPAENAGVEPGDPVTVHPFHGLM
ncbi:hypothetical protein AB833_30730 [Chromatiales bacterium (ex Bugula neritina AB1)]|nr:hypothetical protein AB833_30730 [Chromatiales bacterium (ex Bugula neritina AB1)]